MCVCVCVCAVERKGAALGQAAVLNSPRSARHPGVFTVSESYTEMTRNVPSFGPIYPSKIVRFCVFCTTGVSFHAL